jgi:hypothetical protein
MKTGFRKTYLQLIYPSTKSQTIYVRKPTMKIKCNDKMRDQFIS